MRIIGGTSGDDRLTLTADGDGITGRIAGDRVDLTGDPSIIKQVNPATDFDQYGLPVAEYDENGILIRRIASFDRLTDGAATYDENALRFSTSNAGGLKRAAAGALGLESRADEVTTLAMATTGTAGDIFRLDRATLSKASGTGTITFTVTTANGARVEQTFAVDGTQRTITFDAAFAAAKSVTWKASAGVIVDEVGASLISVLDPSATRTAIVPVYRLSLASGSTSITPQAMSNSLYDRWFAGGVLTVDTNGDGTVDRTFTNRADFVAAGNIWDVTTNAFGNAVITDRIVVKGNLTITSNTKIDLTQPGAVSLSLTATNDITLGTNVVINASAAQETSGAGGGYGGTGAEGRAKAADRDSGRFPGGTGGFWSGIGTYFMVDSTAGQGGEGRIFYVSAVVPTSTSGGKAVIGSNAGGAAGTATLPAATASGMSGAGGARGWDDTDLNWTGANGASGANGGNGTNGADGAAGNDGTAGQAGVNTDYGFYLTGGSGGGAGSAGTSGAPGGEGGGGGGGGGGARGDNNSSGIGRATGIGGAGGAGGQGGVGGNGGDGGKGGNGGAGGGGGGAFELVAYGKLTINQATLSARGGDGGAGTAGLAGTEAIDPGNARFGKAGESGQPGYSVQFGGLKGGTGGNGGRGGDGGLGGDGGAGGDGAGGAGGAAGTIFLRAADVVLSSSTTIDLTPGKGGQNGFTDANGNVTYAPNGGAGRLVILDNSAATTTANVSGAPSGLAYDAQGKLVTTGTLVRNESYTEAVSTPRIVGLSYGAGVAGLMDDKAGAFLDARTLDLDSSRAGVNSARTGEAPAKGLIAVARYASMKEFAAATGGQVTLDQDYAGYDVLVIANISDASFSDVKLGINGEAAKSLALDGFLATSNKLGRMLAGDVWVTLVRESDTTFSVEATTDAGTSTLDGRSTPVTLSANGQWSYVSAPLAGPQTTANLQGLDQILVNGDRIYALQSSTGSLYVLNTDGSVRQSFTDGDNMQVNRFGAKAGALNAGAMAIIDGRLVVYSGDFRPGTSDPWGSVSKYSFGIAANGDLKPDGVRSSTLTAADEAAYTALDTASATKGSFTYTINNTSGALEVRNGTTLIQTLVEGQGGVRGVSSAMDVVVTGDADGKYVIVGNTDGTISAFQRDKTTGLLTARALQVARDGLGGARGLAGITDIALGKLDGTTQVLYVASQVDQVQGRGGFATFSVDLGVEPKPVEISATHTGIEKLDVVTGSGADRIIYAAKVPAQVGAVTLDTGGGADQVTVLDVPASSSQTTTIKTGDGDDTITLASDDDNGRITVYAGADNDTIALNADGAGSQTTLYGEAGNDRIVLRQTRGASVAIDAGEGADTVAISGAGIGASTTVTLTGGNPTTVPGDTLQIDKGTTSVSTTDPLYRNGSVTFTSNGVSTKPVTYAGFEAYEEFFAPTLTVSAATFAEGQDLVLTITADPRSPIANPAWTGRFGFDLDGDGLFTDFEVDATTGVTQVTIPAAALKAYGISDDGTYTIQVKAMNAANLDTVSRAVVTVTNVNPTITAAADSANVTVGQPVRISFGATGEPVDTDVPTGWRIDWGDGTVETFGASVRDATHVYVKPGSFTAKVGQFDNDNPNTPVWSGNVLVTASLPVPGAQDGMRIVVGDAGQLVPGDDLVLRALDVVGSPVSFEWRIGNTVITGAGVTGATTARATVSWSTLKQLGVTTTGADYTITATAKYDATNSFSRTATLSVANVAPTIASLDLVPTLVNGLAQPVREGDAGATVRVTGAADSTTLDTNALTYVFVLPNGTQTAAQSATDFVVPAQFLQQSGTVRIGVKAIDAGGLASEVSWLSLDVQDVAPTITIKPTGTLTEGSAVAIAIEATDPGFYASNFRLAGDLITSFRINWGDGSPLETVTVGENDRRIGTGGEPNTIVGSASHVYADEKRDAQGRVIPYTITVTAIEGARSTSASQAITIANAAPVVTVSDSITYVTPKGISRVDSSRGDVTITAGDTVTLSGTVSDLGILDGQTLRIDWGDGTTPQTLALAAGTTQFSLSHVYALANRDRTGNGTPYVATVTATDKDGTASANAMSRSIIVRGAELTVGTPSLLPNAVKEGETFAIVIPVTSATITGNEVVNVDLGNGTTLSSHTFNNTTLRWEPSPTAA